MTKEMQAYAVGLGVLALMAMVISSRMPRAPLSGIVSLGHLSDGVGAGILIPRASGGGGGKSASAVTSQQMIDAPRPQVTMGVKTDGAHPMRGVLVARGGGSSSQAAGQMQSGSLMALGQAATMVPVGATAYSMPPVSAVAHMGEQSVARNVVSAFEKRDLNYGSLGVRF